MWLASPRCSQLSKKHWSTRQRISGSTGLEANTLGQQTIVPIFLKVFFPAINELLHTYPCADEGYTGMARSTVNGA